MKNLQWRRRGGEKKERSAHRAGRRSALRCVKARTGDPGASCCEISRTITHNHMQSIRESGLIWATRTPLFLPVLRCEVPILRKRERAGCVRARARLYEPRGVPLTTARFAEAIKNFKRFFCTAMFNLYILIGVHTQARSQCLRVIHALRLLSSDLISELRIASCSPPRR